MKEYEKVQKIRGGDVANIQKAIQEKQFDAEA